MIFAILLSFLCVSLPLLIGGFVSFLIKRKNNLLTDILYMFSIGTILGLLIFEMIPEILTEGKEINEYSWIYAIVLHIAFFLFLIGLHKLIDIVFYHHKHNHSCHHDHDHGHIDIYLDKRNQSLKIASFALFVALFFHNFPEGLSFGIVFKADMANDVYKDSVILGSSLFIHNFIMGMSMAITLILANIKKRNTLILLLLSSLPSILGTILGFLINEEQGIVNFVLLTLSSSVLLFVIYEQALPLIKRKKSFPLLPFIALGLFVTFIIHLI